MPQIETMSMDEKIAIGLKALELKKQGKLEEARQVQKQIPLPPWLAKNIKEVWKAGDFLKKNGYNLSEADAEYGPGWLDS
jgi:hypothetical protein